MPFPAAELIVTGGRIYTLAEGNLDQTEALAVYRGRIVALGRATEIRRLAGSQTRTVELQGRTVLPGFIDAHMHLTSAGLRLTGFVRDISSAGSLAQALEQLREAVKAHQPGEWIRARGWDESHWPEKRYLTRADLDWVAPQHPLIAVRVDGHLLTINSRALARLTIPRQRPEEFDEPAGLLRERTAWLAYQQVKPDLAQTEQALAAGIRLAHSLGVTSLHDVVNPLQIKAYEQLRRRGLLQLRVRLNLEIEALEPLGELGLSSGFGSEYLKLGALKFFADGSIGARNAALSVPYADAPQSLGRLNRPQDELNRLVKRAHEAGFQIMIHVIGDRAIEAAMEALERAGVRPGDRARLEHFELPSPEQLARVRRMGIIASMQPNFLCWSGVGGLYQERLGAKRDEQIDPQRAVLERGIPLAFGSDGMPFGPLYGLQLALNAPHERQRLSWEEALRAYTLGGAYAGYAEDEVGSLEVGKWADFIVLTCDPAKAPQRLAELQVIETYLGGERVYRRDNHHAAAHAITPE